MRGFWQNKQALVTGATGIVGGWLIGMLLDEGANVVALVRDVDYNSEFYRSRAYQRVAVVNGQLEDFPTIERAINEHEADTVIHLGAQTIVGIAERSPLATFEANIRGTYHVLEACRRHANVVKRIVVASSDKAYGDHGGAPYQEDGPLLANHPYDVSKACGDLLAQTYAHTYGMPVVIARCGNVYGGGDLNWSRIVPGTIKSLFCGDRPVLRSDGLSRRDYLYVKDAAAAYLFLAQSADRVGVRGEAFNFSGESPETVLAIVERICSLMGRQNLQPIIQNNARNEIAEQALSSKKAQLRLGWSPRYDLTTGLTETIQWYHEFLSDRIGCKR